MSQQSSSSARDLNRRILERIATDPQFREQLLDNPQQAIDNSEFGQEVKHLASQQQAAHLSPRGTTPVECTIWSCMWTS
jgi:hypothetical protein